MCITMTFAPFSIQVPGSTANLGPGFDSVGMALSMYLTVNVFPSREQKITYFGKELQSLNGEKDNLILQAASMVADAYDKELPCCSLEVESELPLSRGLGSSAAAIVAGIEWANRVLSLSLSKEEKTLFACKMEGHPDNVVPSLIGGLAISWYDENQVETVHVTDLSVELVLTIPSFELATSMAREALPPSLAHSEAVQASAVSNVLVASLLRDDWKRAGKMMNKDRFHEPYRQQWFPDFTEIKEKAAEAGAYGSAISGAGPAMVSFVPAGSGERVCEQIANAFEGYECKAVSPDVKGVLVQQLSLPA
ncbi:homoserine kinase [Fictibacillus enclensis]|uniref:homoserine kinase n=1 Tax=Fictibacillus enclensis TaxID=1017270 RepID=UPI0024C04BDA|nr:homoserine kinase [Fictibacillus enclensis]MDM5339707.1 homoserine kinase [Fictibacillus enclensis]WHY71139.1 homoserine kinase [Fictibacillus enclensis]